MQAGNQSLQFKINAFIKKYYLNQILKGLLYTTAVLLACYLLLFTISYYVNPVVIVKTILFFLFIALAVFLIAFWIVKPILAYFKLGKVISEAQAAKIIGIHFSEVKDKLINTLQLQSLAAISPQNQELLLASVAQKIEELKFVQFTKAINLKENRKYLKYVFLPLFIISLIAVIAPVILQEGTSRFVKYDQIVLPKAPFDFVLTNKSLQVVQGDDLTLVLQLKGDKIPQEVYVQEGENSYKLEKKQQDVFQYTFKNIQKNKTIHFFAGGFQSNAFVIATNPNPTLQNIEVTLRFPSYLHKESEKINNAGDLLLPEGTVVQWKFNTQNSNSVLFLIDDKTQNIALSQNQAIINTTISKNCRYGVFPKNKFVQNRDSITHQITVIKDQYPSITLTETPDSLSNRFVYFSGKIADDYGFSKLICFYQVQENGKTVAAFYKPIKINLAQTENVFLHVVDFQSLNLKENQKLVYYFEVADNDGFNGAKKTRSELKEYQPLTTQQVVEKISENSQNIKQKIERAVKNASTLEKESKKMNEAILDKNELAYEDKKKLDALKEKQNALEKSIKDLQALNKKNTLEKQENNFLSDELAEKQKKIDELFDKVLNEKSKTFLEQIKDLTDKKDEIQKQMQESQQDNKALKNELNRILELYKQLEFDQELDKSIERVEKLASEQKSLIKETQQKKSEIGDLKDKQQAINKSFEEVKKEFKNLEKKNEALEVPNDFKSPEKETKQVEEQQQKSEEELKNNDKKKAAENQKKAAEALDKLAQKMQDMQKSIEEEKNVVDEKSLRNLIAILLKTSFEQERVLLDFNLSNLSGQQYLNLTQRQNNIKLSIKNVTDSLVALSKRVPEIESEVNQELQKINSNVESALTKLTDKKLNEAGKHQQFALTSINNLSLMLNEALENSRQSAKKSGKGKGSGKPSMQSLKKMQEELGENMKKAKEQMQKLGNNGVAPKGSMSKEFSKMAQQQQMIREALQKINRESNKNGKNPFGNLNKMIEDMKSTELDLVNKRLSQQMMDRQKDLSIRFLDAENAEKEQEIDSKREAKAAKMTPPSYKKMLEKFEKEQQAQTEQLQKTPTNLNHYYRTKVAEYYKLLNKKPSNK
ncbi:MAG: hypothetical protein K2Q03_01725 [Sphingobacteriaceae bacterium]|nr:hypothetical protein [Sphingobacteriaceae bacterium]